MLSKEEDLFIIYWEKNRLRRKKTMRQFLLGIPAGLLIVVPIVINFSSGWYRRATMEANSEDFNPMVLFIALLLIVGFTAIFWQKHQWDQFEQRYRELLARRAKEALPVTDAPRAEAAFNAEAAPPLPGEGNPTPLQGNSAPAEGNPPPVEGNPPPAGEGKPTPVEGNLPPARTE
jgi:hypothetical protein